jgi:hypothetical protein
VAVPDGREEAQRVPAFAPGVADALVLVEDDEGQAQPLEMIAHGQTRLAAADDHRTGLTHALPPASGPFSIR